MNIVNFLRRNKLILAIGLVYIFLFIFMPEKAVQSSKNSMYYIKEMLEIIPVIFVLTSLIDAWVPKKVISDGLGENSGAKGAIFSLLLGSFSAGPIYAAFPVCKMLLKKGASIYNIVIILSAWAVVKVPMLANEAKFLGVKFMGIRWVLTTISIFVMAYMISLIVKKKDLKLGEVVAREGLGEIKVTETYCVGCGLCVKVMPEHFAMENKIVTVKIKKIVPETSESVDNIVEKCPGNAIYIE